MRAAHATPSPSKACLLNLVLCDCVAVPAVVEAMADGGVRAGLPRPTALVLAAQTLKVRHLLTSPHISSQLPPFSHLLTPASASCRTGSTQGAAEMVLKTGKHPGELKDQVCSPGGTTIAGVEALEQAGFRAAVIGAVTAAAARSVELGKPPASKL